MRALALAARRSPASELVLEVHEPPLWLLRRGGLSAALLQRA